MRSAANGTARLFARKAIHERHTRKALIKLMRERDRGILNGANPDRASGPSAAVGCRRSRRKKRCRHASFCEELISPRYSTCR
jgi:hypothetical protein